eukprot:2517567-Amphidinium_carterae.1
MMRVNKEGCIPPSHVLNTQLLEEHVCTPNRRSSEQVAQSSIPASLSPCGDDVVSKQPQKGPKAQLREVTYSAHNRATEVPMLNF